MNKYSLQMRGFRVILSMMILLAFLVMTTEKSWSAFTYPQVPKLSLCGSEDDYNKDWYPDGRIWLPVNQQGGSAREFLMPVFIDNKWWHYKSTDLAKFLVPEPIHSFRFKILYDGVAITPVDIVTVHPFSDEDIRSNNIRGDYTPPLAKDFVINWDVHPDMNYQSYFLNPGDPAIPLKVRQRGRAITISGTSINELPVTDTNAVDYNVLLYVKFRINLTKGSINAEQLASEYSPLYISPDTVMYNDWNVRKEIAFKNLLYSDSVNILDKYTDPNAYGTFVGLAGMNNKTIATLWNTEPILPGTIYLKLTNTLPRIWYDISRSGSQPPVWDNINKPSNAPEGMWIMRDPITVDSGKVGGDQWGSVKFTLRNSTSETRLEDVYIESEAPWLMFFINSTNKSKYWPVGKNTVKGYVNYLDNDILGGGANKPDPLGNLTDADAVVEITIRCDPWKVIPHNGEKAGIYKGYITFKSHTAEISPVRMQVTFLNYRNPFEPDVDMPDGNHRGINLTIRNSNGATGEETNIIFGTGHRATDLPDSLFGEFAYTGALAGFGARFYHPDKQYREDNNMPFGFGDMFPNRENPQSESRDIRDVNDTAFSHIYLCRFNAGAAQNYPVVIEWDTTDFPQGSQLFLSDTLNGSLFPSINMREGTHVSGNILSYTIEDPKITSFKIEYTQPRIAEYVDAYGNPIIKKGWNLLSLPVRPKNSVWNVAYPNCVNKPFSFFNSGYQPEEILRPGVGYFMKYSDSIDTKIKGSPMKRITADGSDDGFADEVHVYPGWNTIGALSFPMNIKDMDFDSYGGYKPTKAKVLKYGIWGYRTDEGYYEISILEPGIGYWMKTPDHGGYLRLIHPDITKAISGDLNSEKQNILTRSTQLVVRDNGQHTAKLYLNSDQSIDKEYFELPPLPPYGLFDARFYTNTNIETNNTTIIKLQGVNYPVSLSMNDADANYTFIDAVTGQELGKIIKGQSNSVEIKSTSGNSIKVLKSEIIAGLSMTNYPNPVTLNSTIKYTVPEDGFVSLRLYDALGNVVSLDQSYRIAGEYTYALDASKISSGTYVCKLTAGTSSTNILITVVK